MISGIESVLIADDSVTARMIIKKCLEIAGLGGRRFIEAKNGLEVLEILQKEKVDLIVTDLNMPVLDGKALLERIKSCPDFSSIPVIVITSGNNPAREKELNRLGAAFVVNKPASPAKVVHALSALENLKREVRP